MGQRARFGSHGAAAAFFLLIRVGELLRAHGSVFRFTALTAFALI